MIACPTIKLQSFADGVTCVEEYLATEIRRFSLQGGGVFDLKRGNYCIGDPVRLDGIANVCITASDGARLVKSENAAISNTGLLHIVNSRKLTIERLRMLAGYSSSELSTGSTPGIMLGEYLPDEEGLNEHIKISGLEMEGFNWSAIMLYGLQNGSITQSNENIEISGNCISNSSTGIFVYKSAKIIDIKNNIISGTAQDSIALDTRAESDAQDSVAISQVCVAKNKCTDFGKAGQGVSILAKGAVSESDITMNCIADSSLIGGLNNYAILIGKDYQGEKPCNIDVEKNDISNIYASGSRQAMGILVNESRNITTRKNNIDSTGTYGVYYEKSTGEIVSNKVVNAASSQGVSTPYAVRVEGDSGNNIGNVTVGANTVEKGSSPASIGIFMSHIETLRKSPNYVSGFASGEIISTTVDNIINA